MKSAVWVTLGSVVISGCVRAHVTRLPTAIARPATCAAAVVLFPPDSVPAAPYIELARIKISHYSDVQPTDATEQRVQRQKAAELGATGLLLAQARDQHQAAGAYTTAIFVPSDTARVVAACATGTVSS